MHRKPVLQKAFQKKFTDTDPVQTPNLYLILTFLNKKGKLIFLNI